MAKLSSKDRAAIKKRYEKSCPIQCPIKIEHAIDSLSTFFAVFHSLIKSDDTYWFRGHADLAWTLAPSALRYRTDDERDRAIMLLHDFKRLMEMKLPRPPAATETLKWMQIAQHHGLPTRLLDWTQNAAAALYFACCSHFDKDGLVVILRPLELSQAVDPSDARIYHDDRDAGRLDPYVKLDGRQHSKGLPTIGVMPTWVTERIFLQQGFFTLHGSKHFALDGTQASSLAYVPILSQHKQGLFKELERVGVSEMFMFPEAEYLCRHLRRKAGL
jgi:hypothetical protein